MRRASWEYGSGTNHFIATLLSTTRFGIIVPDLPALTPRCRASRRICRRVWHVDHLSHEQHLCGDLARFRQSAIAQEAVQQSPSRAFALPSLAFREARRKFLLLCS